LWQFIRQRLADEPSRPPLFPNWLDDLPARRLLSMKVPCRPPAGEWDSVMTRGALRTVQASPEEPEAVRRFLQEALTHGVDSAEGLDLVRLSSVPLGPTSPSGVSPVDTQGTEGAAQGSASLGLKLNGRGDAWERCGMEALGSRNIILLALEGMA